MDWPTLKESNISYKLQTDKISSNSLFVEDCITMWQNRTSNSKQQIKNQKDSLSSQIIEMRYHECQYHMLMTLIQTGIDTETSTVAKISDRKYLKACKLFTILLSMWVAKASNLCY
jgi:hypothetical protein